MLGAHREKRDAGSSAGVVTPAPATSLLDSVHQQFLAGCFGLGVLNTDLSSNTQLYHYQVHCIATRVTAQFSLVRAELHSRIAFLPSALCWQ